jgi:putative ABC transport system permease protein
MEVESDKILEHGIENWQELMDKIKGVETIQVVTPEIGFSALASTGDRSNGIFISSIVPNDKITMGMDFIESEPYQKLVSQEDGIILGKGLAQYLNANAGDGITLMTTTVDGALNATDFVVVDTISTFSSEMDKRYAIIHLASAQDLLATNKVEKLVIGLYETSDLFKTNEKLSKLIGPDFVIRNWEDLSPYYHQVMVFFNQLIAFLAPILMIIVWFSTMNTILMSVMERSSELATLRAVGTSKPKLLHMLMMEGIWIGIIGVILGFVIEVVLSGLINHSHIMLPPPPGQTSGYPLLVRNASGDFLFVGLLTIVVVSLSTILPALRIFKLNIVDALRKQ